MVSEHIGHDQFVAEIDGERFAGTHLIMDLWGGKQIDDLAFVEATLRESVEAAGATLLCIKLHHFTQNNGISGVAILAESHIAIHSWPEHNYTAIDIFMCGTANPLNAAEILKKRFLPDRVTLNEQKRGLGI